MRISKRVVRIPDSTQCFEYPVDISLPRPRINLDFDPVRYIKSVPIFCQRFIGKSELFKSAPTAVAAAATAAEVNSNQNEPLNILLMNECNQNNLYATPTDWFQDKTPDDADQSVAETIFSNFGGGAEEGSEQYSNDFIHYCLFIFHGIYNANKMIEHVSHKEFKVRILMLNYRIKEAFTLCISDTTNVHQAIKTFEYFTKDLNVVPIHREDLKFLIYELFLHFINKQFSILEIEQFFLKDLDYYLFALAYVLYFNNNNSDIERQVVMKYSDLFGGDELDYENIDNLEKSEIIFKAISISFKSTVCQKLFDYEDNFT